MGIEAAKRWPIELVRVTLNDPPPRVAFPATGWKRLLVAPPMRVPGWKLGLTEPSAQQSKLQEFPPKMANCTKRIFRQKFGLASRFPSHFATSRFFFHTQNKNVFPHPSFHKFV